MQIVGIIVTGFISLLIGVLGFPQIIGCIKYFYLRKPAKNFGTIFVWVIVLGIVGIIAHVFFIDYIAGYYAGTVIAFIRSFSVKPFPGLDNFLPITSPPFPKQAAMSLIKMFRRAISALRLAYAILFVGICVHLLCAFLLVLSH